MCGREAEVLVAPAVEVIVECEGIGSSGDSDGGCGDNGDIGGNSGV